MRILHVTDKLSERGGAYIHLLGVLHELARRHDMRLAVGEDDGTAAAPCPVSRVAGLAARTPAPVDLEPLVRALRPGVIHVHNVVNPTVLEWAALHGAVMTVQDHRFFCPGRGKWTASGSVCTEAMDRGLCTDCFRDQEYYEQILRLTERRLEALRQLRRVIVLSRYMQRELAAAGVLESRIAVIPPFVHGLDRRAPAGGPPCVLFVGRLVRAKGVEDAVSAWRRSGLERPLVLAGTGPLREDLARSGRPDLELPGWIPHADLAPLYGRAAALLMPSRWQEPFGIAGLEALAFGVPVVAWDSGGIRDWHPHDETLVEWGNVDALARALARAPGRRAVSPPGFEPALLMEQLQSLYSRAAA